jgi:phosphatidylserine/phosphatidylglycerophosphate/cardiolipin synthase-like enzyme
MGLPSVQGSVGPVVVVVVQPAGEGVQAGLVAQVEPGIWAGVKTYDLAGVPVRVLFAPDHTPELEIVKQLLKGSRSATRDLHLRRLFRDRRCHAGVGPRRHAAQGGAGSGAGRPGLGHPQVAQAPNIKLYVPKREGPFARLRKLHHKLMVIDEQIVVAGSFNYTAPANAFNDENITTYPRPSAMQSGIFPGRGHP